MALIKCTECNKKFSEYANACPNCACPIHIVKKQMLYDDAINIISSYKNINELYEAKRLFKLLNVFKDSCKKIEEINDLITIEKKQKIYNKTVNIISDYKSIEELYNAKNILKSLGDFKDSSEKLKEIEKILNNEEYNKKQKLYNKAINIISNYKNINELYEAKRLFKLLNGFKDSYKKIEEIKCLLNFENECKKINIIEFVKSITIIILICLSMYLLVDIYCFVYNSQY